MKDAYYFSHDANAQNDPNIVKLLFKHGWSGYGLYWAIIEKLRNEPEYIMDTDYDMIAYALRTNSDLIESIIGDFNLFVIEKECFYSPSLKRRMGRLDEIKEKRVYAGKMSGISRNKAKPKQSLNKKGTGVEQVLNSIVKHSTVKYSKAKNSKSIKTLESIDKIHLSELQNKNLDVDVEKQFDMFKDYLASNGKTYQDYRAGFRNWLKSSYCEKTTEIRDKRNKKVEMKARVIEKKELLDNSASQEEIKAEIDKALGKISRKYTV